MCGRKEVYMSDDRWKAEDRVLFSIYNSCHYRQCGRQASTKNGAKLLPIRGPKKATGAFSCTVLCRLG